MKNFIKKYQEIISFAFFGVLTTLVNWISYAALTFIGLNINLSNVLAWVIAVIFAFVVNKLFVFKDKSKDIKTLIKSFLAFILFRLFAGIIEIVGLPLLLLLNFNFALFGIEGFLAKIIISAISFVLNYLGGKLIWRTSLGRKEK